jgi:signal peptidase II
MKTGNFKKNIPLLVGAIAVAVVLDQATKILVTSALTPFDPPREIIGSLFRFRLAYNPYGVFSLSYGHGILYYVLTVAGVLLFTYIGLSQTERLKVAIFGLIIGGALGNLLDRLRLGHVIDYIDMGFGNNFRWFTYNVADAFITIGAIILIVQELFFKKKDQSDATPL